MSLQTLVLNLLRDVDDPAVRSDIANTIFYLRDLFLEGMINEDQLRNDLTDVISTVLDYTHPELIGEEKKRKVDELVDQFVRAIKIMTLKQRVIKQKTKLFKIGEMF